MSSAATPQINELFNVAGLSDVCTWCSQKQPILDHFGEDDAGKAHGKILVTLENFFERRNEIAHALNPGQSNSPEQIAADIDMLENFGLALKESLGDLAPQPPLEKASDRVANVEATEAVPTDQQ